MDNQRILHLTLKKKWFTMIASGEKKEEYREIKPYWIKRLSKRHIGCLGGDFMVNHNVIAHTFKNWDIIRFTNGYGKNVPTIDVEFLYVSVGQGLMVWGAEKDKEYFVIRLGKIISFNAAYVGYLAATS